MVAVGRDDVLALEAMVRGKGAKGARTKALALVRHMREQLDEYGEATASKWIEAARDRHARDGDLEVRVDDDAAFSVADDAVWVTGWLRFPNRFIEREEDDDDE